ncbi:uncharacterized protein MICPUCDRAFT_44821 [Micromonas pusilla CCMP1545]|uniref:Predicted protein n=1 Tax=Micromonas pusilla (strain CCMP1545) TaxID=564608 RepID=C1N3K0_MICPC|nr:uncharacterized protein MICPUCDRAFT_44821 [Micromonas pusilla CCMP1545]EEH53207.1 predicted protein [Micromonas pusilla CCMP1545]|eukprot:XP_003062388.1 predicted protein [Micromonas pusilla CCMP1545]
MSDDAKKAAAAADRDAFLKTFESLRSELVDAERADGQVQIAIQWIDKMVEYNVPHGKLNRGLAVIDGVRALKGGAACVDDALMHQASVVGWCIEWLQAAFLVWDDIMDESVTRRGQPCWYKSDGVDMNAINDGLVLECQIYSMLKSTASLSQMFRDVTDQTAHGQLIDLITGPIGVVDLSKYTEEAYMPHRDVQDGVLHVLPPGGERDASKCDEICRLLGQFFQIQDDYLDCYGDPAVIGKIGTDIMDNKCGWLVVQALKKCTAEQRKIIEDNYGKKDAECEKRVKALYVDLGMEAVYQQYEEDAHGKLKGIIEGQDMLPAELFGAMLAKIYKRTK